MQIEFSQVVQQVMDRTEAEMSSAAIWQLLDETYGPSAEPLVYKAHQLKTAGDHHQIQQLELQISHDNKQLFLQGAGNGPIDALVAALRHGGFKSEIVDYEERALNTGSGAEAIAIVAVTSPGQPQCYYGMGTHSNITTASIFAVLNGLNRLLQKQNNEQIEEALSLCG
ncbi:MAG: alpha-isopropylmalate synthase regulatory domain-containing protein [Cyanobacteria bacterium J06607_17]